MEKKINNKEEDLRLIEEFKKGSIESFEELMRKYEPKVFNLAIKYTKSQEDAEEVLQDVFTTLYTKIESFEGKSAFSSWIYRVTINACFMKLRKGRGKQSIFLDDLSPSMKQKHLEIHSGYGSRSDSLSIAKELREKLKASIQKLPKEYRSVFVLRDVDGLSNEETAKILEMSVPAVKSRLHRARIMLRKKLLQYWGEYQSMQNSVEEKLIYKESINI